MKRRGFFGALFGAVAAAPSVVKAALKPDPEPSPVLTPQEMLVREWTNPERGSWTEASPVSISNVKWECYAFVEHKKVPL